MELRQFIIEKLKETELKIPRGYTLEDVVELLINGATIAGWPTGTRTRFIQTVPQLKALDKNSTYKTRFCKFYGKFHCVSCDLVLPVTDSVTNTNYKCKHCDSLRVKKYKDNNREKCREVSREHYRNNKEYYFAKNAKARATKLNATPAWSNDINIQIIYEECPTGSHVDHIIPLQGLLVSGLHVEENLQYLTAIENISKSNKVDLELESETQLSLSRLKMKLYYNTPVAQLD